MTSKKLTYKTKHVKAIVTVEPTGEWSYTLKINGNENMRKAYIVERFSDNIRVKNFSSIKWDGSKIETLQGLKQKVHELNCWVYNELQEQEYKQEKVVKDAKLLGFEVEQ